MNISVGKTTLGRKNWFGSGPLLVGLTALGILAGVGIWQATDSASETIVAPVPVARSVDFTRPSFQPTYVYVVDSQAQADVLYQADFEAQMSFGSSGTFNHDFRVINVGTPEGREELRSFSAGLAELQLESPADASLVHVLDMTVSGVTKTVSLNSARPVAQDTATPQTPTYFYIVESKEQADKVYQAEAMAAMEAAQAGMELIPHYTQIIDVSTLEGQQLLNTINAEQFEMWADPNTNQSLVHVIDARTQ